MFGGKGRKKRKRWIALLLAGAMVLSGMGISPISVQAEETAVEQVQETELVENVVEERVEQTVSGGDVVVPEIVETEVVEMAEESVVAARAVEATAPVVQSTSNGEYVLDENNLPVGNNKTGTEIVKSNDEEYFTLIYKKNNTSKIENGKSQEFTDYTGTTRINFGGGAGTDSSCIKFTTKGATTVTAWWQTDTGGRELTILNEKGDKLKTTNVNSTEKPDKSGHVSTLELEEAGTYYLGSSSSNIYIYKVVVKEAGSGEESAKSVTYSFEPSKMNTFSGKSDKDIVETEEKYFTILCNTNTKIEANSKTIEGYEATRRLSLGGKLTLEKCALKFETREAAKVKIWWSAGDNGREMNLWNKDGKEVAATKVGTTKNSLYYSEFAVTAAGTYYLGGANGSNYIYKVEVTESDSVETSITGNITLNNVPADVTVTLKPAKGDAINLTQGENAISTMQADAKYEIVVSDSNYVGTTAAGLTYIQTGKTAVSETITISDSVKKVKFTLAEGSVLREGKEIALTNKADTKDTVKIEPGNEVDLKVGTTYTISTDMAGAEAQIDGKKEYTVKTTDETIVIALVSKMMSVAFMLEDSNNVLGGNKVQLININDDTDVHALTGENVTLAENDVYVAKCDVAKARIKLNGADAFAAVKDSKLEVIVTEKENNLYELDLCKGLKAGEVYDGGISVLEDMPYKVLDGGKPDDIGGIKYPAYIAGTTNPYEEDGKTGSAGTVPKTGSALILKAQNDGKIKVAMKINAGKTVYMVDATDDAVVGEYKNTGAASEFTVKSYNVERGHTYYLYGNGTKVPMYAITVDYRDPEAWDKIATPVLGTPVVDNKVGTITVPYTAQIGGKYADSIEIKMISGKDIVDTITATAEGSSGMVTFTPSASGKYSFQAVLRRTDCLGKNSTETEAVEFTLPMKTPTIIGVENQGAGNVRFTWKEVTEATYYNVYLNGELMESKAEKPYCRFEKLTVGKKYSFGVEAVRVNGETEDKSDLASIKDVEIKQNAEHTWNYAAFGSGVDTKNNGHTVNAGGSVTMWSQNTKGKLVPASTDGLAFYYTTIDPKNENFVLSADVTVDTWKFTNGQEGFGLMAADNVGTDGDASVFWNNSYMASVTKVEYYWDAKEGKVSDSGDKYTMKLGIGSQEKIGVTPENVADGTSASKLKSTMATLETSVPVAEKPAGTYNVVGGYSNQDIDMGDFNTQTKFHLEIRRDNTGYAVSYTDANGTKTTNRYYHGDDGDELTKLDENNIYVGFFASRSAKITVSNIKLDTSNPATDAPAEERPITFVTPNYSMESSAIANSADYELVYYGNADGTLTITNSSGQKVVDSVPVDAKTKSRANTTLNKGDNAFVVEFIPDADYKPSTYEKLSNYDAVKFNFTVTYNVSSLKNVYISPNGSVSGTGTKENPKDIYSAVKAAAPGQTLILMEGTYVLNSTVTVERGINGTEDAKIYMIADPEAKTRPVLDFQRKCAGMILAGDYWYFRGFDVTNTANAQKGIQVSGSYNTLEDLMTYKNGNTGLQISRYLSTDQWEDWPSHNLILNCTSYLNADAGYEDADGFAAKLTIADGNVFEGCISAYNADDGWDLFAKVESGPIGKVVIKNCVAFKNGYVIDADGKEVDAGNGNGFKMGGSSITGYHTLQNSVAFGNKAKGIDSNSCPDIQIYNSTSYNNESYNVALYTNDAKNTDFLARGILSFKDANGTKEKDNLKLLGSQDESKVYGSSNYFFNGKKSSNTVETGVATVASSDWFKNLDMDTAIHGGITRNADGTINMNGFLEVTDKVPAGVGARISDTATPDEPKQDDSKSDNSTNGDAGSTGSAGTSSAPETVNWNEVSSSVQDKVTELAQNPAIATVNMNIVCTGEVQVPQKVLNTIKGTNVTVAFHSGNGVAMSISGQDLKNKDLSKIQNIDLTVDQTSNNIPANVVAAKTSAPTRQLAIKDSGSFGVNVNIHVNVGKENAGKTANLYRYNVEKGRLEYCGSFTVTSNGQSMFTLKRGGNYLVTVTERRPSEGVWFAEDNYIVKAGDTLSKIAQRNHMTLTELLRRNAQITNRNVIKVGQRLNLN